MSEKHPSFSLPSHLDSVALLGYFAAMSNRKGYKPPADVDADRREILDQNQRRIGFMWPEDFEALNAASFGTGWIAKFSRYAGMSRDTVDLYRRGRLPIPKYIAQLVLHIRWEHMNRPKLRIKRKPDLDPYWLGKKPRRKSRRRQEP